MTTNNFTEPSPQQVYTSTQSLILPGRWLHFGVQHKEGNLPEGLWSSGSWDQMCGQCKAWGMSGVHLKVADGLGIWYDDTALQTFLAIARKHSLLLAPYMYCWGNTRNSNVQGEAERAAHIGKLFGIVVLDMETEWENQPAWAQEFGYSIRRNYGFEGHLIYTTYANPASHPFPYTVMNRYASAWMPQVYYDLWTFGSSAEATAAQAINYVFPQWEKLDQQCREWTGVPLKPTLPIIDLTRRPAPQEVTNWLVAMQGYGYCGFWYDGVYGPYAETVLRAPEPRVRPLATAPAPTPPKAEPLPKVEPTHTTPAPVAPPAPKPVQPVASPVTPIPPTPTEEEEAPTQAVPTPTPVVAPSPPTPSSSPSPAPTDTSLVPPDNGEESAPGDATQDQQEVVPSPTPGEEPSSAQSTGQQQQQVQMSFSDIQSVLISGGSMLITLKPGTSSKVSGS